MPVPEKMKKSKKKLKRGKNQEMKRLRHKNIKNKERTNGEMERLEKKTGIKKYKIPG